MRLYASTARSVVLRCCGWAVAAEPGRFEVHVAALEARGQWELAALSAAFHAQLERAVRSLERGDAAAAADDPPRAAALRTAAMLVAGFAPAAPLWCGAVHSMASRLPSVHLRLLLALLCSATATGAGGGAASAGASLVETSNHRDTAEARPSATATGDVASSDDAPPVLAAGPSSPGGSQGGFSWLLLHLMLDAHPVDDAPAAAPSVPVGSEGACIGSGGGSVVNGVCIQHQV